MHLDSSISGYRQKKVILMILLFFPVCAWIYWLSVISIFPQTKSCSSFPEWLRLNFKPDKIFWAGEDRLCSTLSVLGDWHRAGLCPALCLLLFRFMFRSAWHRGTSSLADSCVVLDNVAAAADVKVESSPSIYSTTSRGLSGTSTLLSMALVAFWERCVFS